jgi:hypothetical protein
VEENAVVENEPQPPAREPERAQAYPRIWGVTILLFSVSWLGPAMLISDPSAGVCFVVIAALFFIPFIILSFWGYWRHLRQKYRETTFSGRSLHMPARIVMCWSLLCQYFVIFMFIFMVFDEFSSPFRTTPSALNVTKIALVLYLFAATLLWLFPEQMDEFEWYRSSERNRLMFSMIYSLMFQAIALFLFLYLARLM